MRDILTGLAIILIVALTTILVAPYFVDWNGQRAFLETRLSRALGQTVTIGGHIDLKLLPTPYLVLDQVVVGDDDAPVRIGVHHLDLELSAAPLLHGAFDITEARLEEPRVRLTLTRDRALPALPAAPAFAADVRFDRIRVSDGTLAVADPESGRTFQLEHVDLNADAGSFAGPFKLSGSSGPHDRRTKFRLATAAIAKGQAHARLIIDETAAHAGAELDGNLRFRDADPSVIRQTFDGTLALTGHVPVDAGRLVAWRLSGLLNADASRATLDGGELRLGAEDAGLTMQAKATLDIGEHPKLALDLSAKHLDIDRLSGAPVDDAKPPPPQLPDLDELRRLLAAVSPPVPTEADVAIDDALYGGETLSHLVAHVAVGGTGPAPLKLAGDGPGDSHVALDGNVSSGETPGFEGRVDLAVDNLPHALAWLRKVRSSASLDDHDLGIGSLRLAGRVKAARGTIASGDIKFGLDRSTFMGSATLAYDRDRPALTADVRSDSLDLDDLPSLAAVRGATRSLGLDLHLGARTIKVARVGEGSLETGPIDLRLAKQGSEIDLKSFRADDLGGAMIIASGHLGPAAATLEASLVAGRVDTVAALVKQLFPGAVAATLTKRAPALAPAKLTIDTTMAAGGDRLTPTRLSIAGTLGQTRLDVRLQPGPGGSAAIAIDAAASSRDGNALLRQLGVATLPIESIGASHLKLTAAGRSGEPLDTSVEAKLGESRIASKGRFDVLSATPKGVGSLDVQSPDITPLLQALAVAFPDMSGHLPAHLTGNIAIGDADVRFGDLAGKVAGTGLTGDLAWRRAAGGTPALTGSISLDRLALADVLALSLGPAPQQSADAVWSRQPFSVGLIDPPRTALSLKINTLAIDDRTSATEAHFDLGIAPNLVIVDKLAAGLSDGGLKGSLTVRRDGRQASLEGKIGLDKVALRLPWLSARATATLDFAGGGTSSATLIASLAGSGSATASDLEVKGGDPTAFPKVFADVESDALAVDQETIVRAFADAARGPLTLGTRPFALSLAAGVLHVEPKDTSEVRTDALSGKLGGTFDLGRFSVDAKLDETLHELPKNWSGAPPTVSVTFEGAPGAPSRSFDVSGFVDKVASRALAREQARIEAYEFDIRERAFFNARLQADRRREAERQKAEDDARRAEAERKARAEAARQERLRAEQAAKAARELPSIIAPEPEPPSSDRSPPARAAPRPPTDPSAFGRY